MKFKRWVESKGIKGKLKGPEDFVVKEIIEKKFLKKFTRTGKGVQRTKGPYTLFLMEKRNLTTEQAIRIVAKELNVSEDDVGFAGLKDKFAITQQYITIKSDKIKKEGMRTKIGKNIGKGVEIEKKGFTDKKISVGNLICNEFEITLHNCRNLKNIAGVTDETMKRGMPNYFGLQRFGKNNNNHIIGKHLVRRKFEMALELINKNNRTGFSNISHIPKNLVKFFINAYQSWIFNKTIEKYIGKNSSPYFSDIKIFGYKTKLGNSGFDTILKEIIRNEKIKQKDFMINELKVSCNGSSRKAFIKLKGINYKIEKNKLKLGFTLPKGGYATVLLNEVMG